MIIKPCVPNCGSGITDVRISELTDDELSLVKSTIYNRCVVVLRDQFLGPADQRRFAERLGDILIGHDAPSVDGVPGVLRIQNAGTYDITLRTHHWHTDFSHEAAPASLTILAAQVVPTIGGDTLWSNQYMAYDALSDMMKGVIRGKRVGMRAHKYVHQFLKGGEAVPEPYHPLVRTHGDTRRKSLYVGLPEDNMTTIQGMTASESKPILNYLWQHSQRQEFVYRHHWRAGDVVIWDNRCTMHYAVYDYGTATRDMNRIMLKGEVPVLANG